MQALGHLALIQQDILQIRAVYHPSVGQVEKIRAFLAKATSQDFREPSVYMFSSKSFSGNEMNQSAGTSGSTK